MAFPTTLDAFGNPTTSDLVVGNADPTLDLAARLSALSDAIEAIQSKVGIDSSAITASIDYKLNVTIPASIATVSAAVAAIPASGWTRTSGLIRATTTTDDLLVGTTTTEFTSGTELKMFFDQSKGAFRAGCMQNTNWNDASRGNYSAAFGNTTQASGTSSFATGSASVASATDAVCLGGGTASGAQSVCMSSGSATAAGAIALSGAATGQFSLSTYSGTASGYRSFAQPGWSDAPAVSQQSHGGYLASSAKGQACEFIATKTSTSATPIDLLFDGGVLTSDTATLTGQYTNVLTLPINTMHKFTLEVTARNTTTPGTFASYHITGSIVRSSSGNARFISTPVVVADEDAGASAWDCAVSINTSNGTNNYLVITVTGAAATNINWVGVLRTVQNSV